MRFRLRLRDRAIAPVLVTLFVSSSHDASAQEPPAQGYPPPQQQPYAPPQQQQQYAPPQQQYAPPQQQYAPTPQQYPQQQPAPQQQYPQQQQPPPAYPPQRQYPQQQQQYPQQQPLPPLPPPQGYRQQQPYPQEPPSQGYYPQQQLPPPQGYSPQQLPPPGYAPVPPPPLAPQVPTGKRDNGEMLFLYSTSIAWGIGSGVWVDGLAHVNDPGVAFVAPLALGAAAPIALFLVDNYEQFDRGVPSSIATGLTLGAIEGIAISGTQWQNSGNGGPGTWSFQAQSTLTWVLSTAGGIGGYAYGEWFKPDPRSLSFIVSGAGWGAMSGMFLGAGSESPSWASGSTNPTPPQSFGDGASVGGLIGYNAGILATGVASILGYVPSWRTQQAMWLGYLLGTAGASLVYLFYVGQPDAHHGMIANGLGGLAGVGVAAAVTANLRDGTAKAWIPPFQIGLAPTPYGGAALAAYGSW